MRKKGFYEWILPFTYIILFLVCVYLNVAGDVKGSLPNIIVNVMMFLIVGIIFLSISLGSFLPTNRMISDLRQASEKIRKDALNTHSYLWEPYQRNNVELFDSDKMKDLFSDFIFELNRKHQTKNSYYKPSISDYINNDLVDMTIHRNQLNQVAGVLTGLGILGTFIGLSLGLQNFNTGTTAEMTNSIEPLMEGIKVAFHTSIYGMVFSLVFNAVYKSKLYDAETAVSEFLNDFQKYVLPDTENEGMNQLIDLQKDQINAINSISTSIANEIKDSFEPAIMNLKSVVLDFERVATQNQTEAIAKVAEVFVTEMKKSLTQTFEEINQSEAAMCEIQKKNSDLMLEVIDNVKNSTGNLSVINQETSKLINTLNSYSESINTVLDSLYKTIDEMAKHGDGNYKLLTEEQNLLNELKNILKGFQISVDEMVLSSRESNEQLDETMSELSEAVYYMKRTVGKLQAPKGLKK